jgi:hypothetical protein
MAKREKVIVIIAGIALIYGACHFFLFSGSKKKIPVHTGKMAKVELSDLKKLTNDISVSLGKQIGDKSVTFIIARAEAGWPKDPFLIKKPVTTEENEKKSGSAAPEITFVYSGYIEMDGERMCIINGMEYKSGEELVTKGYFIRGIDPKNVVIEVKADRRKIIVPMEE